MTLFLPPPVFGFSFFFQEEQSGFTGANDCSLSKNLRLPTHRKKKGKEEEKRKKIKKEREIKKPKI